MTMMYLEVLQHSLKYIIWVGKKVLKIQQMPTLSRKGGWYE